MKLSAFLLLWASCLLVGAQDLRPGFVVIEEGDSLKGRISYRSTGRNELSCGFRKGQSGAQTEYFPEDIVGYGFQSGPYYQSVTLDKDGDGKRTTVFAEIIIKGDLSLYRCNDLYFAAKDTLVLLPREQKIKVYDKEGNAFFRTDTQYINVLASLMADCRISKFKLTYSERRIGDAILAYNHCRNTPVANYHAGKPYTQFGFDVFFAVDQAAILENQLDNYHFEKTLSFTGGIGMQMGFPRYNDKISLITQVLFIHKSSHGTAPNFYSVDATYSFIKIPIGFRWNFLTARHIPYFMGGINLNLQTSMQSTVDLGTIPPAEVWLGAGYSQAISGRCQVFVEVHADNLFKTLGIGSSQASSFVLLTGLRLRRSR